MTSPEEKEHAEIEPLAHFLDCECGECVPAYMTDPQANLGARFSIEGGTDPTSPAYIPPYRESYARLMKEALAGAALLAALLLPGHASAHTGGTLDLPIIGTESYDAGCQIVREWTEDEGVALAYCPEDGETYLFDRDGNFYYDNGIKFWIWPEMSWRVAPESLQIGPNAPVDAR